ncbi:MAG: PspA/IM30 family protein [Cyanobacteria bacterium REEB65]|nr:PspA/IM30 family protein [Cyanobacteria bacterium REEB65]
MGFLDRVGNLVRGFLGVFVGGLESKHPEAVYDSAIQARQEQYQKLMKAVSGIVYLRNKLQKDLDEKTGKLQEIQAQIPEAVKQGEEQIALQLIEQKNSLNTEIEHLKADLTKTAEDAESHKQDLMTFQAEIQKLKDERDRMLARNESAKARLAIQEQLSGLSVDADLKALDHVRESIHKMEAQADVAREIGGASSESKMGKIRDAARSTAAAAELEQYKVQLGLKAPEESDKNLGSSPPQTEKTM